MAHIDKEGRITVERRGFLRLIGIDRPRKLNAFTPRMLDQLSVAYDEFEKSPEERVAVVFAHGDNFTSGLDMAKVMPRLSEDGRTFPKGKVDPFDLYPPLRTKPVIFAVRGYCYTLGIELMLAADIVVAGRETRLRQHETSRGIMAGGGATIRFVQRAGWGNAMRYLLSGEEFSAEEALRLGLIQEVVESGRDIERALEIAQIVSTQAPLAVAATRENSRLYLHEGLTAAVDDIGPRQAELTSTEDAAEGLQAFLERRAAQFEGR